MLAKKNANLVRQLFNTLPILFLGFHFEAISQDQIVFKFLNVFLFHQNPDYVRATETFLSSFLRGTPFSSFLVLVVLSTRGACGSVNCPSPTFLAWLPRSRW